MIGYGEISLSHVALACASTSQPYKNVYQLRTAKKDGLPMGEIEVEIEVCQLPATFALPLELYMRLHMCSICRRTKHLLVVPVLLSQHKEENVPQHRERLPLNPRTLRSTNVMRLHTHVTIILVLSCIYRFWMAAPCLRRFRQPSVSSISPTF
jgi:hypothetical protein